MTLTTLLFVAIWAALSCVVAVAANWRGRSEIMYFFYSLIASPVIMWLALIAQPNLRREQIEKERHDELIELLSK